MRAVILVLTCAFLQTVVASTVTIIHQEIKNIGETVELTCSKKYMQGYPLLWIRTIYREDVYSRVELANETALFINDSRFAIKHDPASATYVLQIKDIQETDDASYECSIQLPKNYYQTVSIHLTVRKPPIISPTTTRPLTIYSSG